MVQNHYEINVARRNKSAAINGQPPYLHFFSTSERSCVTEREMLALVKEFQKKFPAPEYKIDVTKIVCHGTMVDLSEVCS
jgi:hypothetical protein